MKIPSLSDIPELKPVEAGEYDLRIKTAKDVEGKDSKRPAILFGIDVVGEPNADVVWHRVNFPMQGDDPDKASTMWRMFKEFMIGLGMDTNEEHDTADFVGIEFSGELILTEDKNGRPVNELKKIT